MIEQITIDVGGEAMTITSLPATKALSVLARLTKMAGGIFEGIKDIPSKSEEFADTLHVGKMMEGLLGHLDPETTPTFLRELVRSSLKAPYNEGKAFDEWYEGRFSRRFDDLTVLLVAIFTHNYGDPVAWAKKAWARAEESGLVRPSAPSKKAPRKRKARSS